METYTIEIPPILFSMLSHAGKETSRYVNRDILLEYRSDGDKCALVATDGRRMAIARWNDGTHSASAKMMIPHDAIKSLRAPKAIRGQRPNYELTVRISDDSRHIPVSLSLAGVKADISGAGEFNFPPWEHVVPSYESENKRPTAPFIGLNPIFLAEACKLHAAVANLYCADKNPTFWFKSPDKAMFITADYEAVTIQVVLMPVYTRDASDRKELEVQAFENTRAEYAPKLATEAA